MLSGTIIKLRAIEPRDLDLMYVWENDTEIWKDPKGLYQKGAVCQSLLYLLKRK